MNKVLLHILIVGATALLSSSSMLGQESPTTPKASHVSITQGPEVELAKEFLTIIKWTANNPGGSPVHYGVVHYGLDPKNLNETAKSPVRLNPDHASTIFRVRLENLKPGTTYYYNVGAEEATGKSDRMKSGVRQFTTAGGSLQAGR